MEQSPSIKPRGSVRRKLLSSGVVVGAGLLCGILFFKAWLGRQTAGISPTVRPATEAVLRAQLWSRISGSYWENEMEDRARFVSTLSEHARLDFYRVILLTCKLDTSRATLFAQLVAKDAEPLGRNLRALRGGSEFARLSPRQRKEIVNWIDELKVIAELHGNSMLK